MKKQEKKGRIYWTVMEVLAALIVVLNLLAFHRGFCDWYKLSVYGIISDALGMATGWFSFAIGEILGYVGAIFLALGPVVLLLLVFFWKKEGYRRSAARYGKCLLMTVAVILFIYTLNWIIPFRGTLLHVVGATERTYSIFEVQNVRNHLVEQLNACAKQVPRDENGSVIYDKKAMTEAVYASMQAQAKEYPILSGYYPPMKDALCSDFLDWMDIGGYTYPYTMEVTWNKYCNDLYYAFLLAHESSHHQGYYQENEANFIAFLACTGSDDPVVRYEGYKAIYSYVDNAYYFTLFDLMEPEEAAEWYEEQPAVSRQVWIDQREAWEVSEKRYQADSHPAQNLQETSAKVADVGWSTQSDLLKENGYKGVVKMVLEYYDVKEGGLDSPF
ncbi:MAG: DUF3810 family protein [Lachnospiraceae bacterium]|nr:DUF3810 family protein [Lachnospiraceae bacterium]